jgi:hypothetical protein
VFVFICKRGRNRPRDAAAILLAYRHGLRALLTPSIHLANSMLIVRITTPIFRAGNVTLHVSRKDGENCGSRAVAAMLKKAMISDAIVLVRNIDKGP